MTTPATENTGYSIITDALRNACKLPDGEDPYPEDLAKYTRRLNQLINFIQTLGIRLWLLSDYSMVITAGTGLYTIGPAGTIVNPTKPIQIYDQYYLYSAANGATRRPVFRVSRQEWDMLSTPAQQGPITQIFVDPQQSTLNVNTWLVPDANEATGTLHLVFKNQVTNFVGFTDAMNFPSEWALTLGWGLSSELTMGQPQSVIDRCDQKAAYYLQKLEEWDAEHETSIKPQPDQRLALQRRMGVRR